MGSLVIFERMLLLLLLLLLLVVNPSVRAVVIGSGMLRNVSWASVAFCANHTTGEQRILFVQRQQGIKSRSPAPILGFFWEKGVGNTKGGVRRVSPKTLHQHLTWQEKTLPAHGRVFFFAKSEEKNNVSQHAFWVAVLASWPHVLIWNKGMARGQGHCLPKKNKE